MFKPINVIDSAEISALCSYLPQTVAVLPCLQTQGTVTAVQLQTEAPVVTASGQQVQTLQVVVGPPPCVTVSQQCYSLQVCMLQP